MKLFLIASLILITSSASARQYFQCSSPEPEYSDVMVLNLVTSEHGTLFISSGMQNPEHERTLVNIELEKIENGQHFYQVVGAESKGYVVVPSRYIGISTDKVTVEIAFNGYGFTFLCFARIYNDEFPFILE